jgi:hypothetical protein
MGERMANIVVTPTNHSYNTPAQSVREYSKLDLMVMRGELPYKEVEKMEEEELCMEFDLMEKGFSEFGNSEK